MTDSEFLDAAETLLKAVEASCDLINDEMDVDLDNQRLGTMVTLTFLNGAQIIINLQKPLHEVWMAAPDGGFHFRWETGRWVDTKGAGDFLEVLSRCATRQAGCTLTFQPH